MATSRVWKEEGGQKLVFNDLDLVARRLGGGGAYVGAGRTLRTKMGRRIEGTRWKRVGGRKKSLSIILGLMADGLFPLSALPCFANFSILCYHLLTYQVPNYSFVNFLLPPCFDFHFLCYVLGARTAKHLCYSNIDFLLSIALSGFFFFNGVLLTFSTFQPYLVSVSFVWMSHD